MTVTVSLSRSVGVELLSEGKLSLSLWLQLRPFVVFLVNLVNLASL